MHKRLKALLRLHRSVTSSVVRLSYAQFQDLVATGGGPDWSLSISPMFGCITIDSDDQQSMQFCKAVNPCTKVKLLNLSRVDTRLLTEFAYRCHEYQVFLELASDPEVYAHVMSLEPIHQDFAAGIRDMQELLRVSMATDEAMKLLRELGL